MRRLHMSWGRLSSPLNPLSPRSTPPVAVASGGADATQREAAALAQLRLEAARSRIQATAVSNARRIGICTYPGTIVLVADKYLDGSNTGSRGVDEAQRSARDLKEYQAANAPPAGQRTPRQTRDPVLMSLCEGMY